MAAIHVDINGRPVLTRRKRRIEVGDVVQYGDPRAMAYGTVTEIVGKTAFVRDAGGIVWPCTLALLRKAVR